MPRFFFDSSHKASCRKDVLGTDFPTPEQALIGAHKAAGELRAAIAVMHISAEDWTIVVRDARGKVVGSVGLAARQVH
jgi:hypothetical protein